MGFFSTEKPFTVNRVKSNLQQGCARIKLQQNKTTNIIKMERRKLSDGMKEKKFESVRVQVESLLRTEYKLQGFGLILIFCEFLLNRLQPELYREDGSKGPSCPVELKEPLTSLIWAASRLDSIPELAVVREEYGKLLGRDFVRMAQENSQFSVSDKLVEYLAPKVFPETVCLDYLAKVAEEYNVPFDAMDYTGGMSVQVNVDANGQLMTIPPIIVPKDALEERLLALKRQ